MLVGASPAPPVTFHDPSDETPMTVFLLKLTASAGVLALVFSLFSGESETAILAKTTAFLFTLWLVGSERAHEWTSRFTLPKRSARRLSPNQH